MSPTTGPNFTKPHDAGEWNLVLVGLNFQFAGTWLTLLATVGAVVAVVLAGTGLAGQIALYGTAGTGAIGGILIFVGAILYRAAPNKGGVKTCAIAFLGCWLLAGAFNAFASAPLMQFVQDQKAANQANANNSAANSTNANSSRWGTPTPTYPNANSSTWGTPSQAGVTVTPIGPSAPRALFMPAVFAALFSYGGLFFFARFFVGIGHRFGDDRLPFRAYALFIYQLSLLFFVPLTIWVVLSMKDTGLGLILLGSALVIAGLISLCLYFSVLGLARTVLRTGLGIGAEHAPRRPEPTVELLPPQVKRAVVTPSGRVLPPVLQNPPEEEGKKPEGT